MSITVGAEVTFNDLTPLTEAMQARAKNLGPVLLGPIADSMRATEAGVFHSAGASVGTPWAPLADATLRGKPGNSTELLVEEGDLRASLTERNAPFSRVEMEGSDSLAFGTDDPVAVFHQYGTIHMPARPPVPDPWPDEDVEHWSELLADWILEGQV